MNDKNKVDNNETLLVEGSANDKSYISNNVYQKPELICYGDVRDITLGPSPGFGESGAGVFFLMPS